MVSNDHGKAVRGSLTSDSVSGERSLHVSHLCASYPGGQPVLNHVSFSVSGGQVLSVLGANGAGKSTLLKAISGLISTAHGRITLDGENITTLSVRDRAYLGISSMLQEREVFSSMTVTDNLLLALTARRAYRQTCTMSDIMDHFPSLRDRQDVRAGLLSGGQRRALGLAMLLAQQPRVALLDEPSAGVAPELAFRNLNVACNALRHLGAIIILVEQRAKEALQVADYVLLLKNGTGDELLPVSSLSEDTLYRLMSGNIDSKGNTITHEPK